MDKEIDVMSWANGYMLWLILLLIPMVYYGKQILVKRTQVLIQLGYHGINWFFIEVTSLLFLWTCLIIALAQPRFGYKTIEVEQENRDILIVFDISRSMWANDVSPSRILQAQRELLDFINILEGERVGVIVFAKHPYPRMPFTTDYTMIETLLPEMTPVYMESQGSDIPKALEMAYETLQYDQQAGGQSILLISDGEISDEVDLQQSLTKLKNKEIPVFVIGVGTEEGSNIPLPKGGFVVDEDNEKVVSKRMTENLRDIARETNGAYISSSPSFKDTELLYRDGIMKIESHRSNIQEDVLYNEYYFYFVLLAFFAWTLSLFPVQLSFQRMQEEKRPSKMSWKNILIGFLILSYAPQTKANEDTPEQDKFADIPQNLEIAEELAYRLISSADHTTARRIYESIFLQDESTMGQRALFNAALAAHKEGQLYKSLSYLEEVTSGPYEGLARETEVKIKEEIKIRLENENKEDPPKNENNNSNEENPEQNKEKDDNPENKDSQQGNKDGERDGEREQDDNKESNNDNQSNKDNSSNSPSSDQNQENQKSEESQSNSDSKDLDDIEQNGTPPQSPSQSEQKKVPVVKGKEEQLLENLEEHRPNTTVGGYSSNGGMTW